jgi:hypothetical protein
MLDVVLHLLFRICNPKLGSYGFAIRFLRADLIQTSADCKSAPLSSRITNPEEQLQATNCHSGGNFLAGSQKVSS